LTGLTFSIHQSCLCDTAG